MRVFSHTCSNTEIVCALGCGDLIVGIDTDSDFPPAVVAPLPKLGRDLELDVDGVVALRPNIVLSSRTVPGHERIVEGLRARGLRVEVSDPVSLADIFADIRRIAGMLGVSARGETLVADMEAAMPVIAPSGPRPRVLVEWWPKPVIAPTRQSWATDLIVRAGGTNPWGDIEAKSQPLEDSAILAAAPEAIAMSWCGVKVENYRADIVRRRPGWQDVPAVCDDRIAAISEEFLGRPGPRVIEGYRQLRQLIESV